MRQLPSESIDLIYIDPPFFSGRNYNVIFGDKNEVRSFSDIWEGGMPGYLVWLNARLWEMKRLLKPTGSIFVHLDWHASHYVKVELDKIFGYDSFRNEIIWSYRNWGNGNRGFLRNHDSILYYVRSSGFTFNKQFTELSPRTLHDYKGIRLKDEVTEDGTVVKRQTEVESPGAPMPDVWQIGYLHGAAKEKIGYPTQKPEELLERIIKAATNEGDVVADFFCGGGTTSATAQRLNRRWVACDQSRIAVSITADRVAKMVEEKIGNLFPVPDFTVEHWGIYEAPKLEGYPIEKFREFVVRPFGGKPETISESIHGVRYGVPLFVGSQSRRSRITKDDVARFAKAVYEERRANHGVMLGWNFGQDARQAAEILAARENKRIDFVRLSLVRLESESVSLNKDGAIANVQWDFDHRDGHFTSTQGYTFLRDRKSGRPLLVVEYEFEDKGEHKIACSVQDDQGGERTVVQTIEVK